MESKQLSPWHNQGCANCGWPPMVCTCSEFGWSEANYKAATAANKIEASGGFTGTRGPIGDGDFSGGH